MLYVDLILGLISHWVLPLVVMAAVVAAMDVSVTGTVPSVTRMEKIAHENYHFTASCPH